MAVYGNGTETREKIIQAADRLFLEKGYQSTTFKDICREAHVNQGSIFYHFKTKDELLRQAAILECERNLSAVLHILPENAPPYMKFLLDIHIFWFRFFHDPSFRQFCVSSGNLNKDVEIAMIYWDCCREFIPDFDLVYEKRRLDFMICSGLDFQLATYVNAHMEQFTWQALARYEILVFARIFQLEEKTVRDVLDEVARILDGVNLLPFWLLYSRGVQL